MWRIFLLVLVVLSDGKTADVKIVTLGVGVEQNYTIAKEIEYIIQIDKLTFKVYETPPRVAVSCLQCTEEYPVIVVVRQSRGVLSWEIPLDAYSQRIYNKTAYYSTARTLCPFDVDGRIGNKSDSDVTISLSTSSPVNLVVSLLVTVEKQFILSLGEENKITEEINPAMPRFYAYEFPNDNETDSILLQVTSDNDLCMAVSVQNIQCPVFDLERNVEFDGFWQSVTRSGSITVPRGAFRSSGFYAVLVVRGHDEECNIENYLQAVENRTKRVELKILPTIKKKDYAIAVTAALASLILFAITFFLIAFFYMKSLDQSYPAIVESIDDVPGSAIDAIRNAVHRSTSRSSRDGAETASIKSDSSFDDSEADFLAELEHDKEMWRSKSVLFLCDLSRKRPTVLTHKSQMYLWYLLTVSIFYFLPVVQLVITYQKVLHTTGNENLCFYNFQCAHPFYLLSDFNHVYSNIGYLVLSWLFIALVRRRQHLHLAAVAGNKALEKHFGIPQHFGLFYAMGAALAVEGILSACYHVCPNNHNFQFDTSFMYVISAMCMLKIYHSRHPDVSASACATFGVLALTILLGMCGVLDGTPAFWSIFTLVHLTGCFILGIQIYYLGRWKIEFLSCRRICKEVCVRIRTRMFRSILPTYPSRFLIICLAIAVNWAMAIIGPMYILGNFASYLLTIFMVNLMLYTTFYITMKLINKERITKVPQMFIVFSVITWTLSLYFFFQKAISWRVSPAASRTKNQPCVLLKFYDNHDIWHFLSAASMFFSFMVLLTLDDDLLNVPREQIAVF